MWRLPLALQLVFFVFRCLHIEVKATLSQDADGAELAPSLLQAPTRLLRTRTLMRKKD